MSLKDRLELLRYKRGWTQDELAEAFDVKTRTIQYWLNGREPRNSKAIDKLIDFYMKRD